MDTQNTTLQAAQKSGLFTPPIPAPKTSTKSKPKKATTKPTPDTQDSPAVQTDINFSDQQEVFVAIKSTGTDNPARFNLARKIALTVNRYAKALDAAQSRIDDLLLAHETESAKNADLEKHRPEEIETKDLTVEEMIERVTAALRDMRATPTDVKALLQAMRELNPGMFTSIEGVPPDPCAIAETITGWAGMTGEEIVKQLGGPEKLAIQLSETLKIRVTLHV